MDVMSASACATSPSGAWGRDRTGGLLYFKQALLPAELPKHVVAEAGGLEPPGRVAS
jgi:hypothetical protein